MAITQITPLLAVNDHDGYAFRHHFDSVDEVVDKIRLDVAVEVPSLATATEVLVRLGLTETQARQRIRFCRGAKA